VTAGGLLFVSGHDPERRGRLVYRGQVGREVGPVAAGRAARLAALNALASAAAAAGSLAAIRRCLVLTCFVDAAPGALPAAVATGALALLSRAFPRTAPPVVWIRPVRGLAGNEPVEVELLLELGVRP
jgi:enamine deaminase RidA (YjgF/YER057c/UK114 family)